MADALVFIRSVISSKAFTWTGELYQIVICCLFCIALSWALTKLCSRRNKEFQVHEFRGHRWYHADFFHKPTYCNVCTQTLVRGNFCNPCCLSVHDDCLESANSMFTCKALVLTRRTSMKHHWVRGNLPLCSLCCVCESQCGTAPRLCDLRCIWCQEKVHDVCVRQVSSECDFGVFRDLIVPPYCIMLKTHVGWRGAKRLVVKNVFPPPFKNWKPLLVFANRKSGDGDGEKLLRMFSGLLNPFQVVDLHEISPEAALGLCQLLPNHHCRILVCGGDGTVGWVLGSLDKVKLKNSPHIAILPLGTGNDMARVLGWGGGYTWEEDLEDILRSVQKATITPLDRWTITIENLSYFGVRIPNKVFTMNNYFSLGCDAKVALDFHQNRESQPSWFTSRIFNKAVYVGLGAKDVIEQDCKDLHSIIELELDGKVIDLPELEGIVVLNINSWCGGCNLWHLDGPNLFNSNNSTQTQPLSSFSDGKLEVAGLFSSLHIARLQVALAEPLRIGQAHEIKITLKGQRALPMQVDGEPWEQGPCIIKISHRDNAIMLSKTQI